VVAGVSAAPHVTAHTAFPVHVVLQSPSHLTLQFDASAHVIVLAAPTCSLQVALVSHAAAADAPSLKSQSELAVQVTWLSSPPKPLHWEVSLHVTRSASLESPSHFAPLVQTREHAPSPQSVLQSVPAAHVQSLSVQVHPVPVQVGPLLSLPPHATATIEVHSKAMILAYK
jgi:hypothetical protein